MNITGLSQYSKSMGALRHPSRGDGFAGQTFRLLFIYPILIADKIANFQQTEKTIRNFISVTFLKELFIQNAISIVSMANQIQPLSDEKGTHIDTGATLAKVMASLSGGSTSDYVRPSVSDHYPISPVYRNQLQQKINEKTAIIQQYTKTDPELMKFNPYIEIITMGNLIDVPVIVGTKTLQVDTLTATHILMGSIALRKPLTSVSNLDEICTVLERLNPQSYWQLLNNLTLSEDAGSETANFLKKIVNKTAVKAADFIERYSHASSLTYNMRQIGTQKTPVFKTTKRFPGQIVTSENIPEPEFKEDETFYVLNTLKSNLNQTRLFFKMAMDSELLASQFGVKIRDEKTTRHRIVDPKLTNEMKRVKEETFSQFFNLLSSHGLLLLRSALNSVAPSPDPIAHEPGEGLTTLEMIRDKFEGTQHETSIITHMKNNFDEIVRIIIDSINADNTLDVREKFASVKKFCEYPSVRTLDFSSRKFENSNSVLMSSFTMEQYTSFISSLTDAAENSVTDVAKMKDILEEIVRAEYKTQLNRYLTLIFSDDISQLVGDVFEPYENAYDFPGVKPMIVVVADDAAAQVNRVNDNVTTLRVKNNIIPDYVKYISQYFYFLFMVSFQAAFQKFIMTADVDIETSYHEVTDSLNYSLVLPIEIMNMLHTAIISKGWGQLTTNRDNTRLTSEQLGQQGITTVNETYAKNIIKIVSQRIGVPNLFIIDSKKNDLYYKLMHQTGVIKTKIATLETFVKSSTNKQMTQSQTSSYLY
jgi:hypothetical protein